MINLFKNVFIFILIIFSLASCSHHTPSSSQKNLIEKWESETGIRVLFVRTDALPIVDIAIAFDAGSARDGNKHGLANITNKMLAEGTQYHSVDDIAKKFEHVGTQYNYTVNQDISVVSIRSLNFDEHLMPSVELLSEIISKPIFPEFAFTRLKKQTLQAIAQQQQQPGTIATQAFYQAIYKNHPYAHPVLGSVSTLNTLSTDDIKAFYKQYYTIKNATIVIVGNLTTPRAKKIAHTLSQSLQQGEKAPPIPNVPVLMHSETIAISYPSEQTHIRIGQPAINENDPDYFALLVGNHILGSGTLTSRLSEEVRQKRGLSYSVGSYFIPMAQQGPFLIGMQTIDKNQAIDVSNTTIEKFIKEGPSEKELMDAKQNLSGKFTLSMASNAGILAKVLEIGFYNLPLTYLDTYVKNIQSVTQEQIKTSFKRHIKPTSMMIIIVGNTISPSAT